ncbi:hypothetical protein NEOLEDRAFT_1242675 [Neolentinus lepideus HHB14362 ss-1]|uniref:Zn(2)-C6 fungal-type domain-containing protein n=1 Tax=Neolentinus lepideus HHB14362 ss-1 TaxID=1314782 RepID=A0A165RSH3_9AGAM|nr:hypothetical protein NEOLEDRAFT_1242675 [Neolentinus lepideus HHB14362 ss-1]
MCRRPIVGMSASEAPLEVEEKQPLLSPSPMSSSIASSSRQTIIEFKKDGTVSRMRSHRGNMPSLPQTKQCPLCPAKFTRTTHLNRHMRTHSNERLHRCDTCSSQFTRSDLLTRHKKGCGDPTAQRTRRKSCQSCAESKVKCDLQYPCTKCKNRGKDCIYVGGPPLHSVSPTASRRTSEDSTASASNPPTPPPGEPSTSSSMNSDYLTKTFPALSLGEGGGLMSPHTGSPIPSGATTPTLLPLAPPRAVTDTVNDNMMLPSPGTANAIMNAFLTDPSPDSKVPPSQPAASDTSSNMSSSTFGSPHTPALEYTPESSAASTPSSDVESPADFNLLFSELDALALQSHASRMSVGSNMFQPFFTNLFASSSSVSVDDPMAVDALTWEETRTGPGRDPQFPFPTLSGDVQQFQQSPTLAESLAEKRAAENEPTPEDLQHYLYLFFTAFLKQLPIIHGPTWRMDGKPAVLINAMHACGALYVKTRKAAYFVTKVLDESREVLLQEFAREPRSTTDQIHLILAVSLLQTIGLFHQKASQRAASNIYHGMLVMMIRRCGLITTNASWTPPVMVDAASADQAWREWGLHETAKRALLISYLHDCCHALYFAIRPSFMLSELTLKLPCEDSLWKANNANEWSFALLGPSPYGSSMEARLTGVNMLQVHSALREFRVPSDLPALTPFAHFVVMHTILRDIYAIGMDNPSPADRDSPGHKPATDSSVTREIFSLQHWLHNWLQSWLNGPDTPKADADDEEPPFIANVLPYYWLAQVSILAYQEGLPPFRAGGSSHLNSEVHFRLVKHWLGHIRSFLRKGERAPTLFWDELMKVRLQTKHVDRDVEAGAPEDLEGLLGFFTEN